MLTRLRYAVLLVAALLAIYVGLWPSWLTLGALIALPLVFVALAGLLNPGFLDHRRGLRWFSLIGGGLIGAELIVLFAVIASTPRRPVLLTVQPPAPEQVRVVYNVADGERREWWRWGRRHQVPTTGIAYSQYSMDQGWYRPENPHPVRAIVATGTDQFDTIPVAWAGGGTTEADGCTLAYIEYVFGDTAHIINRPAELDSGAGWLDSLATWGVECRQGRLFRVQPGRIINLRRTGPACYYTRAGGMSCTFSAAAP